MLRRRNLSLCDQSWFKACPLPGSFQTVAAFYPVRGSGGGRIAREPPQDHAFCTAALPLPPCAA